MSHRNFYNLNSFNRVWAQSITTGTERINQAIKTMEAYPETADEYVTYLMYLESVIDEVKLKYYFLA
jgi:DNA integrity scanning protein DisA with diadenylate cyclase activity